MGVLRALLDVPVSSEKSAAPPHCAHGQPHSATTFGVDGVFGMDRTMFSEGTAMEFVNFRSQWSIIVAFFAPILR